MTRAADRPPDCFRGLAMLRSTLVFLAACVAAPPAAACSFCQGDIRTRQTLRMHYAAAKAVLHGQLKNPRFDKNDNGFTDLHVSSVLKDDPARGGQTVIAIPQYLPVIGNTPADFLLFCDVSKGKLDPMFGVPAPRAVLDYLSAATKLDDKDPAAKLAFFFKHLDSPDPTIAADAFFEFARASDADILKAAKQLDAAKVRKLIADPNTPPERLGVYSFLLGVTGGAKDAAYLAALLNHNPLPERAATAFGGLLAGYILLAPKEGWSFAAGVLADDKRPYSVRLSTIGTVRFLQSTRGADCKAEVLTCCAALLPHGDLADQAIEDLRRWGYWDLTNDVLAQFARPTHAAPIVRRSIVRYALCAPGDEAKRFVLAAKQADPKLVRTVEESLELFAPVNPPRK
jgi:hypothetical protein